MASNTRRKSTRMKSQCLLSLQGCLWRVPSLRRVGMVAWLEPKPAEMVTRWCRAEILYLLSKMDPGMRMRNLLLVVVFVVFEFVLWAERAWVNERFGRGRKEGRGWSSGQASRAQNLPGVTAQAFVELFWPVNSRLYFIPSSPAGKHGHCSVYLDGFTPRLDPRASLLPP